MGYLLLIIALTVFVLGSRRSADLAQSLRDPENRRNLLLRLTAVAAMSAWLHALPSLLLVIYMRNEGILATELFAEDTSRATVVGTYVLAQILMVAFVLVWGPIDAAMDAKPWRVRSFATLFGWLAAGSALLWIGWEIDALRAVFVFVAAVPFALYVGSALLTPLERQIRLYWLPFLVMFATSATLLVGEPWTRDLVADELAIFRAGGNSLVTLMPDGRADQAMIGKLVLLTQHTAYVRATSPAGDAQCIVRLPLEHTTVATVKGRVILRKSAFDGEQAAALPENVQETQRMLANLSRLCGPLEKPARAMPPAASASAPQSPASASRP
jgi:hypothetical protein